MSGDMAFADKLRAVAAELDYLSKDKTNDHHGYSYVSEAKVKRVVRAALAKHGLMLERAHLEAMPGSTATSAVVGALLVIGDGRGACAEFYGVGGDQDKSGKAVMKAAAAAIKYALTTGFLIPTGDDPEGGREADELGLEGNGAPKGAVVLEEDW